LESYPQLVRALKSPAAKAKSKRTGAGINTEIGIGAHGFDPGCCKSAQRAPDSLPDKVAMAFSPWMMRADVPPLAFLLTLEADLGINGRGVTQLWFAGKLSGWHHGSHQHLATRPHHQSPEAGS
jgi:hypothetical protein